MASNKRLNAVVTIGGALASSFKSMISESRMQLGTVGSSINQLTGRQRELNKSIADQAKLGSAASALRVQYAQQELDTIGKQITALKRRETVLAKGTQNRATGSSMMSSGGMMIGGAFAMAATMGAPIRAASNLEHTLQMIGNTANMSKVQIGSLKDEIFKVSKASNKSVDDVTGGIGFLIAAGMNVKTASASIGSIAKASTASGASVEDLAKAAFTLNDSLNIEPDKLNAAMNIMAKAGKQGNVELKDMAKQLPVLGAGFKALGMEGDEATGTIGAALQIARKGSSDADEAANNMKNFLAKITSPETLKKAQKHFGVDLYKIIKDAQTKGENPFEASMQAIIKMTKGDQKAIGELFGDMQVQNFVRPMIDKWHEYRRIKRESMSGDDELSKDFEAMMGTMRESTNGLGNAWKRLMITMGETSTPVVGKLSGGLQGVVDGMNDISKEHPTTVVSLMAVMGATTALTAALGIGRLAAGAFMFSWGAIPPILAAGRAAIGATVLSMRTLTAAMASNPVGLALLAGGLVYSNWDSIGKFAKSGGGIGDSKSTWDDTELAMGGYGGTQTPPGLPAMRGNSGNITNNLTNAPNITINQQPGQDSRALAEEVIRKLDQRDQTRRRSSMFDRAMGY